MPFPRELKRRVVDLLGAAWGVATAPLFRPKSTRAGATSAHRVMVLELVGVADQSASDQVSALAHVGRIIDNVLTDEEALDAIRFSMGADRIAIGFDSALLPAVDSLRCALRILEEVANSASADSRGKAPAAPQVRIGLDRGEAAVATDVNGRLMLVGECVEVAKRIAGLGGPSTILLSGAEAKTRRAGGAYAGEHFTCIESAAAEGGEVYQFVDSSRPGLNAQVPDRSASQGAIDALDAATTPSALNAIPRSDAVRLEAGRRIVRCVGGTGSPSTRVLDVALARYLDDSLLWRKDFKLTVSVSVDPRSGNRIVKSHYDWKYYNASGAPQFVQQRFGAESFAGGLDVGDWRTKLLTHCLVNGVNVMPKVRLLRRSPRELEGVLDVTVPPSTPNDKLVQLQYQTLLELTPHEPFIWKVQRPVADLTLETVSPKNLEAKPHFLGFPTVMGRDDPSPEDGEQHAALTSKVYTFDGWFLASEGIAIHWEPMAPPSDS